MFILHHEDMKKLLKWYRASKRSFPWRDTGDPFDVWISEIMLQQTRTQAVIAYFERFRNEIKDIEALSLIEDDRLMRLWEGLGYYSRARNLKRCAQVLMERYEGRLPEDQEALLSLPGIGPYTAGAILSIGFGRPYPAVDGNVLRVLARYFAIKEDIRSDKVRKLMEETIASCYRDNKITDKQEIRDLTQAFMDLGAVVCIPNGKPNCEDCPLHQSCKAHIEGLSDVLPYRSKNKERKIVDRTLFIIRNGDTFLVSKRPNKGLLAGLYGFPGVDERFDEKDVDRYLKEKGYDPLQIRKLPSSKHIFSHVEWHMDAYEIRISNWSLPLKENEMLSDRKDLQSLAIPSAFKTYIDYYGLRESE